MSLSLKGKKSSQHYKFLLLVSFCTEIVTSITKFLLMKAFSNNLTDLKNAKL